MHMSVIASMPLKLLPY